MRRNDRPRRLLLLGFDGGDIEVIRSRADRLPAFRRALQEGRLFELEAPHALSGAVWPSFYNGGHPGTHGVYQHFIWDAQRMALRIIGPDWVPYRPFWKDLEEDGRRVVVLDVPYSFPTSLEHGVEITDWGTHGQTHPLGCSNPDVKERLRRFGDSPIGRETPVSKTPAQLDATRSRLKEAAAKKSALIRTLMAELEWDVFVTVMAETHRAGHLFFSDDDEPQASAPAGQPTALLDVYGAVDRAVAEILEAAGPETSVVLFSVHGMMRNPAQEHVLAPMMERLNARFLKEHYGEAATTPTSGGIVRNLRKHVPDRLQHALGALAPDAVRRWVVNSEVTGGLDWQRTPGFALRTDICSELRLNLVGREAQGMLEPGSALHERYVADLREAFSQLRDADTGARLVEEVVDVHRIFPGPRAHALPDFVIVWRDQPQARRVETPMLGRLAIERAGVRGGDHNERGFALLLGEAPRELPALRRIEDIAGFVRALMREPAFA